MSDHPQLDNFIAVPYRKPDLDNVHIPPQRKHQKGKKTQGRPPEKLTPTVTAPKTDPFSSILPSDNYGGGSRTTITTSADSNATCSAFAGTTTSKENLPSMVPVKRKDRFVPLFTAHGDDLQIKLKGRHPCQCMCTRHNLIHNCTSCGRIVCEQEGSGPCFTCGEFVCTPEQRDVLLRGGLEAEKLRRQILGADALTLDFTKMLKPNAAVGDALVRAEEHRDKLLEYDRTAAQRTKIIDDQSDYFNESVFMTKEQREAIRKKEEDKRRSRFQSQLQKNRNFDLDVAGGNLKVRGQGELDNMYAAPDDEQELLDSTNGVALAMEKLEKRALLPIPLAYTMSLDEELAQLPDFPLSARPSTSNFMRIQDRELQEMIDTGAALSIVQPWAHFVVMGLKPHEGRDWYTGHRGKLWIVSGGKTLPSREVIEEENLIKALTGDEFLVFPPEYPLGCLLGSVDLLDCLTQEEYQRRFPGGFLKYPYILLFDNPVEIERKFPVDVKNKIFKLDTKLHHLAKIQPFSRPKNVWRPELTYGSIDDAATSGHRTS